MGKMYKHIILFSIKEPLKENSDKVFEALQGLKGKIPEIQEWQVVRADPNTQGTGLMDIGLIAGFKNPAELKTYKIHPEHQKVVALCNEVSDQRFALDYWD